jgi:hypothetical protein
VGSIDHGFSPGRISTSLIHAAAARHLTDVMSMNTVDPPNFLISVRTCGSYSPDLCRLHWSRRSSISDCLDLNAESHRLRSDAASEDIGGVS